MAKEPFIGSEERPDLTLNLDSRLGDLTVRQLSQILGSAGSQAKLKELQAIEKFTIKEPGKEAKDQKDHKDSKDHKDPKEGKDQKDTKDNKDPKDQKEQKDNKDQKDHKDPKDTKDQKDHKEPKDHKDSKDHKDIKDNLLEKLPPDKHPLDKLPEVTQSNGGSQGIDSLVQRSSRLEQETGNATSGAASSGQPGSSSGNT